jgi:hypothetical protein
MAIASSAYGTQSLTLAIPLGFFVLAILWGFFQRRPTR